MDLFEAATFLTFQPIKFFLFSCCKIYKTLNLNVYFTWKGGRWIINAENQEMEGEQEILHFPVNCISLRWVSLPLYFIICIATWTVSLGSARIYLQPTFLCNYYWIYDLNYWPSVLWGKEIVDQDHQDHTNKYCNSRASHSNKMNNLVRYWRPQVNCLIKLFILAETVCGGAGLRPTDKICNPIMLSPPI